MTVWARLNPEPAWLDGPSANPYWNVPLTLHSLCGERCLPPLTGQVVKAGLVPAV